MIVDVHTHLWDQPEQMGPGTARRLREAQHHRYEQLDASLDRFDEAMAQVSYAFIHGFHSRYMDAAIPHEQVARYVSRNPAKYLGFAGIDPMDPKWNDSLAEAQDRGLVGVLISPAAQGYHPTHTQAMRLYEQCQKRGMPIMVHPGTHLDTSSIMDYCQPHLLDEVGRTFPDLRLVLAQVGHPWAEQALWLVGKHPNFFADLSDITHRSWQLYNVLLLASQQHVIDHIMLGSDFPFSTPEQSIVTIYRVNHHTQGTQLPTIPREDLRGIVECDALGKLGLTPPTGAAAPQPEPTDDAADDPSDDTETASPTEPNHA